MMTDGPKTILVSSCLLGLKTRYNGVGKKNDAVLEWLSAGGWNIVPVCPEQLAGLPTPRPASRFSDGDGDSVLDGNGTLLNEHDENVTPLFVEGAWQALEIARISRCTFALLKERSPSCGVHQIDRNGDIVNGRGVTAAILERHGIPVASEDDLDWFRISRP